MKKYEEVVAELHAQHFYSKKECRSLFLLNEQIIGEAVAHGLIQMHYIELGTCFLPSGAVPIHFYGPIVSKEAARELAQAVQAAHQLVPAPWTLPRE